MRHIDIEKKQPSRWPWLLGLVLLAAAGWGITTLLAPPPEPEPPAVGTTAADTLPPAAIPMAPDEPSTSTATPLSRLVPLDSADAGTRVTARGVVVAEAATGFWIRSDSLVLRISSARRPAAGDTVRVSGTLRAPAGGGAGGAGLPSEEGATVVETLELVEQSPPDDTTSAR